MRVRTPKAALAASAVAVLSLAAGAVLGTAGAASGAVTVDPDQGPTAGGTAVTIPDGSAVFTQIAAGQFTTLFLDAAGRVWSAGSNTNGELGNGTTTGSRTIGPVSLPSDVTVTSIESAKVSPGASYAIDSSGAVWAWGTDANGQLGDGVVGSARTTPAQIAGIPAMTKVTAGSAFAIGLTTDGTVWAWGDNTSGQLGRPQSTSAGAPQAVVGLPADITDISTGPGYTLALASDGTVWSWGANANGVLGNGTTVGTSATPQQVAGLPPITKIVAGGTFALALAADGTLWAWGSNASGQLATGAVGGATGTPQQVTTLPAGAQVAEISATNSSAAVVLSDGTSLVWGSNPNGELGINSTVPQPAPVAPHLPAGSTVSAVSAGSSTTIWVLSDNSVYVAGNNASGQIGTGTATNYFYEPTRAATTLTSVTFGGIPATNVAIAGTDITATTPAHPSGLVPVGIDWTWGTTPISITQADAYTYGTPPTISGDAPDVDAGATVDYSYAVTGDEAPTVTVSSGTLPPGLSLDPSGHLAGVPTTAGSYTFTLAATNGLGTATLTDTIVVTAATVVTNPSDATVDEGDTATFTASATSLLPLTVQWQISTDGGQTWTDIPGATSDSYTTAATRAADSGSQYRAVFTTSAGSVTSEAATLTVIPAPAPEPTTPPAGPGPGGPLTQLPDTGSSFGAPLLSVAGALLLAAAGLLIAARRRRHATD